MASDEYIKMDQGWDVWLNKCWGLVPRDRLELNAHDNMVPMLMPILPHLSFVVINQLKTQSQ